MIPDPSVLIDILAAEDGIYDQFALEFDEGTLMKIQRQAMEGETILTFSTRYFTPAHVATEDMAEVFDSAIDPSRILENAIGSKGKHLPDNKVFYMRHSKGTGTYVHPVTTLSTMKDNLVNFQMGTDHSEPLQTGTGCST